MFSHGFSCRSECQVKLPRFVTLVLAGSLNWVDGRVFFFEKMDRSDCNLEDNRHCRCFFKGLDIQIYIHIIYIYSFLSLFFIYFLVVRMWYIYIL